MKKFSSRLITGMLTGAMLAGCVNSTAEAWVSGGVVVGGPAYYYPAYPVPVYPYPAPAPYAYGYPPAYPAAPQAQPPVPGGPIYSNNSPAQEDCREYSRDVIIGGEKQMAHGEACRQADGTWQIVN